MKIMKKKLIYLWWLSISTALMQSCTSGGSRLDSVTPSGENDGIAAGLPGKDFVKNVLIWEFTTTDCKFCPYIKRDIQQVQQLSDIGNRIFASIIHGKLLENDPFRFSKHSELERHFGVTGAYPSTIVDHDESYRQRGAYSTPNITREYLQKALDKPAHAGLKLVSVIDNRKATLQVKLRVNVPGNYKLGVSVLESGMVYPQYLPQAPDIDPTYVHNHVLRAYLTDLYGDQTGEMKAGDELTRTFGYTIPEEYKTDRVEFLVYILKDGIAINGRVVKTGATVDYQYVSE